MTKIDQGTQSCLAVDDRVGARGEAPRVRWQRQDLELFVGDREAGTLPGEQLSIPRVAPR
jgi:hypothetical protein